MTPFLPPPPRPALAGGAVHAWRASLAPGPAEREALWALLAPEERAQAERFRFAVHRDRFVAARGQLRRVLARYLGAAPEALAFERGRHGKPRLAGGGPCFSASHSDDLALFAVAEREVGVDLERVRALPDWESVAEQFFAPAEIRALRALAPAEREAAFFACWTRKEALLKACGLGLSGGLAQVEVGLGPEPAVRDAPAAAGAGEAGEAARRFTVAPLWPGRGFAAAVAAAGAGLEVRCFALPRGEAAGAAAGA